MIEVETCNLFEGLLGLKKPWVVTAIERDQKEKDVKVHVHIVYEDGLHRCPVCGSVVKLHDHRIRKIRHLDTCGYTTMIYVHLPRTKCDCCGLKQPDIPFTDNNRRYTKDYENHIINMALDMPISTVSKYANISWGTIDSIKHKGVERGLQRREKVKVFNIGIDETSYQKGQNYVTVILDKDNDRVLAVLDGRKAETVLQWFKTQDIADLSELKSISMDMSDAFIKSVKDYFDNAENLICFDRFHVSQLFIKALNQVRVKEHAELANSCGRSVLTKSKFKFATNSDRADNRTKERKAFMPLTKLLLLTSKVWKMKEIASTLWDYVYTGVAEKQWKALLSWMMHSRIPEMKRVAKTIRKYFWGILNAIRLKVNNSMLEAKNSCIQRMKKVACGYRNKKRFMTSILFKLGKLDMLLAT
jgi:transposase